MNTTCICCGEGFANLSKLMNHMQNEHTTQEIMNAIASGDEKVESASKMVK